MIFTKWVKNGSPLSYSLYTTNGTICGIIGYSSFLGLWYGDAIVSEMDVQSLPSFASLFDAQENIEQSLINAGFKRLSGKMKIMI